MNQKQIFIFLLLLSISAFSISCRLSSIAGGANQTPPIKTSDPFVKSSKPLHPLEQYPNPINFGSLDLRDAVRAFKQKFGATIEITQMIIEPNAVKITLYESRDFTSEWLYENGSVSKLTANSQIDEKPKFEKTAYNSSDKTSEPVRTLTVIKHFQIDEIPLARLPEVSRIAQKQIWIEGGEVKKIEIAQIPSIWSATVAGKQSEITYRFRVTEYLTAVIDQDNFERRPYINALDADEMQQRIERIKEDFGGELKMLNIMVNEYAAISFIAQDPQKPEEFNSYYYSLGGDKRKPSAVADSDIRGYVRDAKELNSKVRSIEDLLFSPADFDFGSLPQIAEKSLNELKLEKSLITNISICRGEYFKYDGGELKVEFDIDGDNRRRSGFARFDVNGKLLKTDKR